MTKARVALAAMGIFGGLSAANAADMAVVPAPDVVVLVRPAEVWQGHFTGGRNFAPGAQPTALDWADVTARFASLRDCGRWMRDLKRQYPTYEGWKGCIRIR